MENPLRHSKFYIEDVMWIFKVEDVLFRLPKRQFVRYSPQFRAMSGLPLEQNGSFEGQTDEIPIVLQDSAADFSALVKLLYVDIDGRPSSQAEWISILTLGHKYEMDIIVKEATESLTDLGPIPKLKLAYQYNVNNDWIAPALLALAERPHPLSTSEATDIGVARAMGIAYARQMVRDFWLDKFVAASHSGSEVRRQVAIFKSSNKTASFTTEQIMEVVRAFEEGRDPEQNIGPAIRDQFAANVNESGVNVYY
ncbi:hypothetical protein DL96DRAFT_1590945 [Flagelloscypha sp. PMI_526]|nr:hypothetical protein DL96DRAFT_1590945 [Flagelloscypha sp. PMI_526]